MGRRKGLGLLLDSIGNLVIIYYYYGELVDYFYYK